MKDIYDPLDKALRAKLYDKELMDAPSWAEFETYRAMRGGRVEPTTKTSGHRLRFLGRVASVAAVVLVLLGSGYLLFSTFNDTTDPSDLSNRHQILHENGAPLQTDIARSVAAQESEIPIIKAIEEHVARETKAYRSSEQIATNNNSKQVDGGMTVAAESLSSGDKVFEKKVLLAQNSNESKSHEKKISKQRTVDPRSYNIEEYSKPNRKLISLGASAGLGYTASSAAPSRLAQSAAFPMSYSVGKYIADVDVGSLDFSHKFPVTVGASVRIPLGRKLSLESGLTYSYLESTASHSSNFNYSYKYIQRSHYLGVPLSLSYSILSSKRWELYCSAGTTVEWALSYSNTARVYDNSTLLSSRDQNRDVKSALWSFHAVAGVNFSITSHFGIYAEPGVVVYTENDSHPITYRTQSPASFNLRAGVRVKL